MTPRSFRWSLLAVLALTSGCAWSNRANRPVWNTFEEHVVPESDAAFYTTLPLTVPVGFGAILTDTLVVHPVQVMPDAWGDAADVWDEMKWEEQYYTELSSLPFRAVGSPIVLFGSWLGRSTFDIAPRRGRSAPERERIQKSGLEEGPRLEARQRKARRLLERVSRREGDQEQLALAVRDAEWPMMWSEDLARAWEQAIQFGAPEVRMQLFAVARERSLPPWHDDWTRGLRDSSALVRYQELRALLKHADVPPELIQALRGDPEEAVRERARERWGD